MKTDRQIRVKFCQINDFPDFQERENFMDDTTLFLVLLAIPHLLPLWAYLYTCFSRR